MSNHIAEGTIAVLVVATLKMENPEHVLLTWCAISGIMSGYVGSILFPVKGVKMHSRWIMSVVCAVTCGPILTTYIHKYLPDISELQLALVASGACAIFGVGILKLTAPLIKPILIALLPPAITKLISPDDKPKNDGHGS